MSIRYVRILISLHLMRLYALMNMIASCKRRDDLLAEYITLTECSYHGSGRAKGIFPNLPKRLFETFKCI